MATPLDQNVIEMLSVYLGIRGIGGADVAEDELGGIGEHPVQTPSPEGIRR